MHAKSPPPEAEAIYKLVRGLFLGLGGGGSCQDALAEEWASAAASDYRIARHVRPELDRLAEAIDELDRAIVGLRPGLGLRAIEERLTPEEYTTMIEGIRPRDDAPTPPRRADWGALGRTLRAIARKARKPLPTRQRDERADNLIRCIAVSWRAAKGEWPGWGWRKERRGKLDGPFIRHMRNVFSAAGMEHPKRVVVERVLKGLKNADLLRTADGSIAVFYPASARSKERK